MESSLLDVQKYFEERMARFEADLQKKSSTSTGSLADEFSAFKIFVLQSLKSFSQHLDTVAREVDNLETRSRRKILLLHGIAETTGEEAVEAVTKVVQKHLKIDSFTSKDVKRCQRMGRQTSSQQPRPILVKLQSVAVRDSIWFSKTKLKGTGITFSEFLTKSRHRAFMAARDKFGVHKCWTREGSVYVLSSDGNRHRIVSIGDIANIQCPDVEDTATVKTISTRSKRTAQKK